MDAQEVAFELGNTAVQVGEEQWEWRVLLGAGDQAERIRKVVFRLHETFLNPTVTVPRPDPSGVFQSPPHTGWGTFAVGVEVHWDPAKVPLGTPSPMQLAHRLSFGAPRTARPVLLVLRPDPASPAPAALVPAASPVGERQDLEEEPEPEAKATLPSREELMRRLAETPFTDPSEELRALHGRAFRWRGGLAVPGPEVAWRSSARPRENSAAWLTATEYADRPEVLEEKVALLAGLLLASQKTVAYTGAGISVAAGIGQAAAGSQGGGSLSTTARPTPTHHALAALQRADLLHGWVQQNHDGLPQKAGYPQERINEVHGSWYDPSNPVVLYSGSLRGDLCSDMRRQAQTADLALVMGTSLSGLNADQVARTPATRSLGAAALGTVIISPQRTAEDGRATLRIFAKADAVMVMLAEKLGSLGALPPGPLPSEPRSFEEFPSRLAVPYDHAGRRRSCHDKKTYWDLQPGQRVRLGAHNNVVGAQQPAYDHLTADTVGRVLRRDPRTSSILIDFGGGAVMELGLWWLEAASRGAVLELPVVNVSPGPVLPPARV